MNNLLRVKKRYLAAALMLLLSACGGVQTDDAPPQRWQNLEVRIDTRPSPPRAGMNEVLVMVTDTQARAGYDLIVSLRTSDQDKWVQAIEDGGLGVYRRAVVMEPGARSVLQVKLEHKDMETVLRFPLKVGS